VEWQQKSEPWKLYTTEHSLLTSPTLTCQTALKSHPSVLVK
jgi:hypothetical protein